MPTYTVTVTRTLDITSDFEVKAAHVDAAEEQAAEVADYILSNTILKWEITTDHCTEREKNALAKLGLEWQEDNDSIQVDDVVENAG